MNTALIKDLHVQPSNLPWKIIGDGSYFKLLRTCVDTGSWVLILRNDPGTSVPAHKHIGAAEYFVLKGKVEVRGGVENGGVTAIAGDYGFEPNGVVHDKTYFPELTEYLFINHGSLDYIDEQGNTVMTLDCQSAQQLWDTAEIATHI